MIYRIVCDGIDIYGDTIEKSVLKPHLEIELNSAGSLEFTLPPENEDAWNFIGVFKNEIEVWENEEIIWFGRPLQITRDWNNQKKVVCEGALAYFNDTLERTNEIKPTAHHNVAWFFNELIESYNSQIAIDSGGVTVEDGKSFTVGTVDIEDSGYIYRKTDYQTTMECLQQMCLDTDGGYFILRKVYDGTGVATRYIDWVQEMPYGSDQDVVFGLNLLDITQDLNGADICTVLVPSGADDLYLNKLGTKDPAENEGVGHYYGSDEIWYQPGIELYGRVLKTENFSDFSDKDNLWTKAHDWLIEKNKDIPTIEINAADLHYIREYKDRYNNFKVGMKVLVNSKPHDLDQYLIIYKLSMDLDSGVKKVTIGTPPKKELTDIIAPSSGGGSTRGTGGAGNSGDGGSSGGGSNVVIPVKDVKVKKKGDTSYSSVVSKKIAKIDLTDMGTDVVANPQGEPTGDLETIQIDDVIYDLGGGKVKDVKVGYGSSYDSVVDQNGIAKLGTIATLQAQSSSSGGRSPSLGILSYQNQSQNESGLSSTRWIYPVLDNSGNALFDALEYFQRSLEWDDCFKLYPKQYNNAYKMTVGMNGDGDYPLLGLELIGNNGDYKAGKESSVTGSEVPILNFVGQNGIKTNVYGLGGSSWKNKEVDIYLTYDDPYKPFRETLYSNSNMTDEEAGVNTETYIVENTGTYAILFMAETTSDYSGTSLSIDGHNNSIYQNEYRTFNHSYVKSSGGTTYTYTRYFRSQIILARLTQGSSISFIWKHGDADTIPGTDFEHFYLNNCVRTVQRLNNMDLSSMTLIYSHGKFYSQTSSDYNTTNYAYNKAVLSFEIGISVENLNWGYLSMYGTNSGSSDPMEDYFDYKKTNNFGSYSNKSFYQLHYENSPDITYSKTYHCDWIYRQSYNGQYASSCFVFSLPVSYYNTPTGYVTTSELNNAVNTLESNFQDGVDEVFDACVSKGSTPASYALADVVDAIYNISGGESTQINPFPSGATTVPLYNSNGITVNSSTINQLNGTATMNFNEAQAGYEGFVIELNVTAGDVYIVEFDYQNISVEYFVNNYVIGWLLEESPRTDYQDWGKWTNNIPRDNDKHHHEQAIIPSGNKIYLNFNVCGYSDSRVNTAEITDLKVYRNGGGPKGVNIIINVTGDLITEATATSLVSATATVTVTATEV